MLKKFISFNSFKLYLLYKFINNLMHNGKKDKAIKLFKLILFRLSFIYRYKNPYNILFLVFMRLNFVLTLKKKKVAGRTHYVPLFLNKEQQFLYGLRTFVVCSRLRLEKNIVLKITEEISCILNKDLNSVVIKKKRYVYNQAIENKFYAKFL
jgi:small subunit ribosomal protein S7